MNYYQAREIKRDGKGSGLYHYTVENDGYVMAVGYCSPWENCPDCKSDSRFDAGGYLRDEDGSFKKDEKGQVIKCSTCNGSGLVQKKDPCPGHATEEEACEHYKQYQLDKMVIHGPKKEQWPKEKCEVENCDSEATYLANFLGCHVHQVCEKHANRESISSLFRVGQSWSSY